MTNAGGLLEPMPDMELMGHRLHLGRPELAVLMKRYVPDPAQTLLNPRTALVVTRFPGEEAPLRETFEHDGWSVKSCAGPGKGDCPIMRGENCALRESADAAVVFIESDPLSGGLGNIPRLRCAADSASAGVVAVEGSFEPTRYGRGLACVGALRGPDVILSAVSALLASNESD